MSAEANFEGHEGRECGEHRTCGKRAWCYDCRERCSDVCPCKGCELPQLRNLVSRSAEHLRIAVEALEKKRDEYARKVERSSGAEVGAFGYYANVIYRNAEDDFCDILARIKGLTDTDTNTTGEKNNG